jgi:acetyl/propionyl-CoA carboxylase alpha subunit
MAFTIILDGAAHHVEIAALRPHLILRIDGRVYDVNAGDGDQDGLQAIEINGKRFRYARAHDGGRQILRLDGRTFDSALVDPRDAAEAAGGGDHVRAPMPGGVVEIHKRPGEQVSRGDPLVTIESMKLQITLVAPRDGTLSTLTRRVGETFDKDEIVAELARVAPRDVAGD